MPIENDAINLMTWFLQTVSFQWMLKVNYLKAIKIIISLSK